MTRNQQEPTAGKNSVFAYDAAACLYSRAQLMVMYYIPSEHPNMTKLVLVGSVDYDPSLYVNVYDLSVI